MNLTSLLLLSTLGGRGMGSISKMLPLLLLTGGQPMTTPVGTIDPSQVMFWGAIGPAITRFAPYLMGGISGALGMSMSRRPTRRRRRTRYIYRTRYYRRRRR